MKRMIATILSLCMLLALCGCGGKELTQEERERIFLEEAQKKGLNAIPGNITEVHTENGIQGFNEPIEKHEDDNYVEVTDVRLTPLNGSLYTPSYKIRFLFPEGLVRDYPNQLRLHYNFLDMNGNTVSSLTYYLSNPTYNMEGWSDALGGLASKDSSGSAEANLDIAKVSTIEFIGYTLYSVTGMTTNWTQDWRFTTPIRFEIANLPPPGTVENAAALSSTDGIEVEKVSIRSNTPTSCYASMKVRNKSGLKRDVIEVEYQALDKAGDVIASSSVVAKDLENGQAGMTENMFSLKCSSKDIGSIKITGCSFGTFGGGSKSSWTTKAGDGFELSTPIVFTADEIVFE